MVNLNNDISDRVTSYQADTVIFAEGEASNYLYIIKTGRVRIVKVYDGKLIPISILGPGSFLGESAIFTDELRSADAITLDPSQIVLIKKSDIKKVIKLCPDWVNNIMKTLCHRLSETSMLLSEHQIQSSEKEESLDAKEINRIKGLLENYRSKKGLS
mgnify:CR=1 FL=1